MPMRKWRPQDLDASIETFRRAVHDIAAADYSSEELQAWAPDEADYSDWERRMDVSQGWTFEINGKLGGFITTDLFIETLYNELTARAGGAPVRQWLRPPQRTTPTAS